MDPSLLLLADGRFPAGSHATSAGVESAVRHGDVDGPATLERYLAGRLATSGVVDAAFAASACCRAFEADALRELDAELDARLVSPVVRAVSRRLGRQLVRATTVVWPSPSWSVLSATPGGPHQSIALGVASQAAGGTPRDAATLAMHHLASTVCTAGVRLLGLDPMASAAVQQRGVSSAVAEIAPEIDGWATADPADLPALSGALAEILAEDHGSWDARLFVA